VLPPEVRYQGKMLEMASTNVIFLKVFPEEL